MRVKGILFILLVGVAVPGMVLAQGESETAIKQAQKKLQKMRKLGYEFEKPDGLEDRMTSMFDKLQLLNARGEKKFILLELTSKNPDSEVAMDLMQYKLPVELAARITGDILQMIETEIIQSTEYWQLGGHDYFLEVQLAIDEVALATALNLKADETIYQASRQLNKNFEYSVGLLYDRDRMLDLFVFEAGNYEILDTIYWLTRDEQNEQ